MSDKTEKYTIMEVTNGNESDFFINGNDEIIGKFFEKQKAELVCRLLNENENKMKIDVVIKNNLIYGLKNNKNFVNDLKLEKDYENAIKAIENLATEE